MRTAQCVTHFKTEHTTSLKHYTARIRWGKMKFNTLLTFVVLVSSVIRWIDWWVPQISWIKGIQESIMFMVSMVLWNIKGENKFITKAKRWQQPDQVLLTVLKSFARFHRCYNWTHSFGAKRTGVNRNRSVNWSESNWMSELRVPTIKKDVFIFLQLGFVYF